MMLGGGLSIYVDIPSIVWMAGVLVGGLWMTHGPVRSCGSIWRALTGYECVSYEELDRHVGVLTMAHRLCWGGGLVGMFAAFIAMLADLSDPAAIGASLAVSLLAPLYGVVLAEFLFAPLTHATVSRSIVPADRRLPRMSLGSIRWKVAAAIVGVLLLFGGTVVQFYA